jgi:hypothetical protein
VVAVEEDTRAQVLLLVVDLVVVLTEQVVVELVVIEK